MTGTRPFDEKSDLESTPVSQRQQTSPKSAELICVTCSPAIYAEPFGSANSGSATAATTDVEALDCIVHSVQHIGMGALKQWWSERFDFHRILIKI